MNLSHLMRRWRLAASCMVLATADRLSAQVSSRFERITIDQGLSQNTVRAVLQDSAGFIWIGTQDGLNRYDGNTFKVFRQQEADSTGLSSHFVLSLREEPGGVLWIGTNYGLNRLQTRSGRLTSYFFPSRGSIPSNNWIRSQLRDRSGRLWVGSQEGLGWLDEAAGQLRPYPLPGGGQPADVIRLLEDRAGALWLGTTAGGLVRLASDRRSTTIFRANPGVAGSLLDDTIAALYEDTAGTLWVGSNKGLMRYDGAASRFVAVSLSPDPRYRGPAISDIQADSAGRLWIATEGAGVFHFDPRTGTARHHSLKAAGLSDDAVYALARERGGTIWLGTPSGGAYRLDPGLIRFEAVREAPAREPGRMQPILVMSLLTDNDGTILIGTIAGDLYRFDRRAGSIRTVALRRDAGETGTVGAIRTLARDHADGLWLSTSTGIYRLSLTTNRLMRLRAIGLPPSFERSATTVRPMYGRGASVLVDSRSAVWAASDLAVVRIDSTQRVTRTLPITDARIFLEDRQGDIWAGTEKGLYRIDPDSSAATLYRHRSGDSTSLSDNDVRSIVEDKEGTLWVGTAAGLNAFDRSTGRFRQIRSRHGLNNEFIYSILPDRFGDLWLSTNLGIERLSVGTGRIRHYDIRDGLQSNEFNSSAAAIDGDGFFYFGGMSGFNYFDPQAIHDNPVLPQVAITGFKRFNRPEELSRFLDARGRLVLPARDN
ncbi:MAG: hypothetical protein HOP28_04620, partial [Gemmatimonadales bacterium]|nr:hypothetical protein [Gemmatimonadales bacterium]